MPESQAIVTDEPSDFAWVVMSEEEQEAERVEWQTLGGDLGYVPGYQVA